MEIAARRTNRRGYVVHHLAKHTFGVGLAVVEDGCPWPFVDVVPQVARELNP